MDQTYHPPSRADQITFDDLISGATDPKTGHLHAFLRREAGSFQHDRSTQIEKIEAIMTFYSRQKPTQSQLPIIDRYVNQEPKLDWRYKKCKRAHQSLDDFIRSTIGYTARNLIIGSAVDAFRDHTTTITAVVPAGSTVDQERQAEWTRQTAQRQHGEKGTDDSLDRLRKLPNSVDGAGSQGVTTDGDYGNTAGGKRRLMPSSVPDGQNTMSQPSAMGEQSNPTAKAEPVPAGDLFSSLMAALGHPDEPPSQTQSQASQPTESGPQSRVFKPSQPEERSDRSTYR